MTGSGTRIPCQGARSDGEAPDRRVEVLGEPDIPVGAGVLAVSEAGVTRHVEIDGCPSPAAVGSLALKIFPADRSATVPVAEGSPVAVPGVDQTCLRIDHAFAAAGDYRLHISFAGADAGNTIAPGRLFYRFF